MKQTLKLLTLLFLLVSVFGCATTVGVNVERPAELNLNGAASISIIPFSYKKNFHSFFWNNETEKLARYTTEELEKKIVSSEYLTLVDSKETFYALKHNLELPCDVYIQGQIEDYHERIIENDHKVKTKDSDGNEITKIEKEFQLKVRFSIFYEIIDGKTKETIYSTTEHYEKTSSDYSSPRDLPYASTLAKNSINSYSTKLMKRIAPYTVHRNISMMKDKSKNPNMKYANELVKNGQINLAKEEYLKIYNQTGQIEAGYNAARLMEAQGNYEEAEALMSEIFYISNNKKASRALNDIRYEIRAARKLENQIKAQEERKNQETEEDSTLKEK